VLEFQADAGGDNQPRSNGIFPALAAEHGIFFKNIFRIHKGGDMIHQFLLIRSYQDLLSYFRQFDRCKH